MHHHKRMFIYLLFCLSIVFRLQASSEFNVHLKVTDENSNKIDKFEVMCNSHGNGSGAWKIGNNGEITLSTKNRDFPGEFRDSMTSKCYQLIIRAEGFAPEIFRLDRPKGTIEKQIVLQKGKCELILKTADGRRIPENLKPIVVFSEFETLALSSYQFWSRVRFQSDLNMTSLVKVEDGRYVFNISDDSPEFFVIIDCPGFLRAFRSGPYNVKQLQNNKLHIELPQPADVDVKFEPPEDWVGELPFKSCSMRFCWNKSGTNEGYPVVITQTEEPRLRMDREYFAPGDYWISFNTMPKNNSENQQGDINIGAYRDMKKFSLEQGQSKTFNFEYTPYDPNGYKGDCNATFKIQWSDKSPAVGEPYSLYYEDRHYDSVLVKKGTLNDEGNIDLNRVNGNKDENYYTLLVREGKLGRFLIQLDCEQKISNLVFSLAPIEGHTAPDITLQDVIKNQEVKLSDFWGKVILLEFWHTSCGPCQRPMASLCELQNKKKTDWDEKVELLAISMDGNEEVLINHIKNRDWLAVRHFRCHKGEKSFKSDQAVTYAISGVPTALIIDKNGMIVWRGHPTSVNIEAKIDELLQIKE